MFETLSSKELYKGSSYSFSVDTYRLPDGKVGTIEQLHHPGGVCVLALSGEGRIPLVSQYRYAVRETLLEIPAGKLDKIPGETPEEGALRELREETGCIARSVKPLGVIYPSPGVVTEKLHLYSARICGMTGQETDADEFISVKWVTPGEFGSLVADGSIRDAKTICAWTLARASGFLA